MKNLTIPLPDDLYQWAQAEAERQHRSLGELFSDFMISLRGDSQGNQPLGPTARVQGNRQQWLNRLRHTRAGVGAQSSGGPSTSEILDDLRADRC